MKYSPKIVIFYEEGLYGLLAASRLQKGVEFRTWIRREVMPSIREKGYYTKDNGAFKEAIKEDIKSKSKMDIESLSFEDRKFERYKAALESAKMFKEILDDITKDSTYKFLFLKKLYVDAGIDLPKYIEEERF